jgi:hypothetical protein
MCHQDARPLTRRSEHATLSASNDRQIETPKDTPMPFGDLLVLVIVILPVALPIALLRAEPLRLKDTDTPAVA